MEERRVIRRGVPPNHSTDHRPEVVQEPKVDRWHVGERTPEWDKRLKKAMAYAKSPGVDLSKQDRYDLAKMVPGVDSDGTGSWKDLTERQLDGLLNMLEGYVFITHLRLERENDEPFPE